MSLTNIIIQTSWLVPDGKQVLMRRGEVVAIVNIGDPIEDAKCDKIMMNQADYEKILQAEIDKLNGGT